MKKAGSIKLEYSQKVCADIINVKIIVTKKSTGITRKSLVLISYGVSNALECGKIFEMSFIGYCSIALSLTFTLQIVVLNAGHKILL